MKTPHCFLQKSAVARTALGVAGPADTETGTAFKPGFCSLSGTRGQGRAHLGPAGDQQVGEQIRFSAYLPLRSAFSPPNPPPRPRNFFFPDSAKPTHGCNFWLLAPLNREPQFYATHSIAYLDAQVLPHQKPSSSLSFPSAPHLMIPPPTRSLAKISVPGF